MAASGSRVLLYALLLAPLTAAARRSSPDLEGSDLQTSGALSGVYDVRLLVTRHGLSCTNIIQKWVGKLDAGRRHMHDPLLGGVGVLGCREGQSAVERYLKNRSLPPFDAVLSSVLARAMQTALLTYPQQAAPLYVVPFIREHHSGLSNEPKEPSAQLADLNRTIPSEFHVDYRWVDAFGRQKGSWDQFLHFLEQFFLPDLIFRLQKPPGSTIVLPVVTHNKFMRESDVGVKCKDAFKPNPSGKPLNNQVVEITYAFHSGETSVQGPLVPFASARPLRFASPSASAPSTPHAQRGVEASSVLFTIPNCGEPRAMGQWRQAGTHGGQPAYANVADSQVMIRWSNYAWQLVIVPARGFGLRATVLYEYGPDHQWKIAKGYFGRPAAKEPIPSIILKDSTYSLRETSNPCESVYPGVKLTDAAGNVRAPICLKDVGESCIEPIKKYSWNPGKLWQQTYEGMIEEESEAIALFKAEMSLPREDRFSPRAMLVLRALGYSGGDPMWLAKHEAQRAKLANATCWSGGRPDASRGNVGVEG